MTNLATSTYRISLALFLGSCLAGVTFSATAEARRSATSTERSAITAAVRAQNQFVREAPAACDRAATVRVSTVDRRYAIWTQNNTLAARISSDCAIGDGFIILRLQPNGRWRVRTQGSGAAPCSILGVRIARDLTGLPCD